MVLGLFLAAAAVADAKRGAQVRETAPTNSNSGRAVDDVSLEVAFESGAYKDHTYSNEPLGFSLHVPKNWKVISKSEIKRVSPQAAELNAQAHPERSEQIRENSRFMAMLFMAAERKPAREQLSLTIMAVPIDKEGRTLSEEALLHQIAEKARLQNRPERHFGEPREKTYGGRKLWQGDLQRSQSGSAAFMREVIFVHKGLLVLVVGGAPDRAALDKLEEIYATLRFIESSKQPN